MKYFSEKFEKITNLPANLIRYIEYTAATAKDKFVGDTPPDHLESRARVACHDCNDGDNDNIP